MIITISFFQKEASETFICAVHPPRLNCPRFCRPRIVRHPQLFSVILLTQTHTERERLTQLHNLPGGKNTPKCQIVCQTVVLNNPPESVLCSFQIDRRSLPVYTHCRLGYAVLSTRCLVAELRHSRQPCNLRLVYPLRPA